MLGKRLRGGEVIELRSDLGGGKTTFVRGLVRGIGSKDIVSSPTFTLSKIYKLKDLIIYHYDLYRLDDPGILANQLAEALDDEKAVTVIEWGEVVEDVLPKDRFIIKFELTKKDSEQRHITIQYPEAKRKVMTELESEWPEVKP